MSVTSVGTRSETDQAQDDWTYASANYPKPNFFNDSSLSDVKIKFSGQTIAAHRVIMSQGSEHFQRMFCGGFKEAGVKEVELFDDDPDALEVLLRFIYGHEDGIRRQKPALACNYPGGSMEFGAQVYVAAEKYGVPGLKTRLMEEYMEHCKNNGKLSASDLVAAIKIIWASTPDTESSVRPLLICACGRHFKRLIIDDAFEQALRDHDMEIDVCRVLAGAYRSQSGWGSSKVSPDSSW